MNRAIESRYEPTAEYLRERAARYLAHARRARNDAKTAQYRDIANIFAREADAQQAQETTFPVAREAPGLSEAENAQRTQSPLVSCRGGSPSATGHEYRRQRRAARQLPRAVDSI